MAAAAKKITGTAYWNMWDVLKYMLEQYPDSHGGRFGIFVLAISMALSYLAGEFTHVILRESSFCKNCIANMGHFLSQSCDELIALRLGSQCPLPTVDDDQTWSGSLYGAGHRHRSMETSE